MPKRAGAEREEADHEGDAASKIMGRGYRGGGALLNLMSRELSAPDTAAWCLIRFAITWSRSARKDSRAFPRRRRRTAVPKAARPARLGVAAAAEAPAIARVVAASLRRRRPRSSFSPLIPDSEKTATLGELREFIGDCQRCKLAPMRTNLVFGVGNPQAELMFVGEAPGADEDVRGEPFVGRAGQLLTDIIERGMGMTRADVYICNVIKCRPPENRNPEPDEVAACEPFLFRQIDLVRPQVIVGLGTFAVQSLLKVKTPISQLRGNWQRGARHQA